MKVRLINRAMMLAAAIIMLISFPANVFAQGSKVTYDGDAKKYVFLPGTDLFDNFKGVMPGDILNQEITVKNYTSDGVKVKIYLRADPVEEQYRSFISHMSLKIVQDGGTVLYSGGADKQGGLASDVCLGTFYPGTEVNLIATLTVPLEMGNEFQNSVGKIRWVFTADEEQITPVPKTGDTSELPLYIILSAVSAAGLITLLLLRVRRELKNKDVIQRER